MLSLARAISVPLILLGMLAGCAPPAPSPAQIAAQDDATCSSYGLQYGTSEYANCREQIALERQQAANQQRAIVTGVLLQHYFQP